MKSIAATALAALCLSALPPAHAQTAEEQAQDEQRRIVVEGERQTNRAARDQARELTPRAYSTSEPLPRFQADVCPGVWGLSPEFAQPMIDRIYSNAERAGIPVNATENCRANVWIIVVDDPQETYNSLREERSFLVRGLHPRVRREIAEEHGSTVAWHRTSMRTLEGAPLVTGFEAVTANMAAISGTGAPIPSQTDRMSRTRTAIRQDIDFAILLVERSALADRNLFGVADFATMRLLGRARVPENETAFSTVLAYFTDEYSADEMTMWDRAYLRSMYRGLPNRPSSQALRDLGTLMMRENEQRPDVTPVTG
ncbi:hypothetical protein [Aurantiacibacter gangjinensis]|nr:hypothetical protein [Aurantiacibacter gangjinensis]